MSKYILLSKYILFILLNYCRFSHSRSTLRNTLIWINKLKLSLKKKHSALVNEGTVELFVGIPYKFD